MSTEDVQFVKCADCGEEIPYEEFVENVAQCSCPTCQNPLCPVCIGKYTYEGSGTPVCKTCAEELRAEGETIIEN